MGQEWVAPALESRAPREKAKPLLTSPVLPRRAVFGKKKADADAPAAAAPGAAAPAAASTATSSAAPPSRLQLDLQIKALQHAREVGALPDDLYEAAKQRLAKS